MHGQHVTAIKICVPDTSIHRPWALEQRKPSEQGSSISALAGSEKVRNLSIAPSMRVKKSRSSSSSSSVNSSSSSSPSSRSLGSRRSHSSPLPGTICLMKLESMATVQLESLYTGTYSQHIDWWFLRVGKHDHLCIPYPCQSVHLGHHTHHALRECHHYLLTKQKHERLRDIVYFQWSTYTVRLAHCMHVYVYFEQALFLFLNFYV